MTTIQLHELSKKIQSNTVIDCITYTMNSGKVYGFQGINGSGKTMLMRLISGLIRPTKGTVSINEKLLWENISFPESIGVFLENPGFLDSYTGFQNLKMLASIKSKITVNEVKEMIEKVGLNPNDKKKYRKYSLGMKQRLGIACALMEKSDIVILDEPTNSLDSDGVQMVKELISGEKERGALVIISCHDAEILSELADEIIVLKLGKLTEIMHKNEDGEFVKKET